MIEVFGEKGDGRQNLFLKPTGVEGSLQFHTD